MYAATGEDFMHLIEDIQAYRRNDPAARSVLEVLLLYNGSMLQLVSVAHWFHEHKIFYCPLDFADDQVVYRH